DQPLAGAQGRGAARHRLRRAVLARAGTDGGGGGGLMAALRRILQVSTWALAVALVALPVVAVLNGWIGSDRWPLRTLRVNDGLERVDAARLREALLPHAQAGFFAVRLDEAQAVIARLPWVEHAEVRKHWPDVL